MSEREPTAGERAQRLALVAIPLGDEACLVRERVGVVALVEIRAAVAAERAAMIETMETWAQNQYHVARLKEADGLPASAEAHRNEGWACLRIAGAWRNGWTPKDGAILAAADDRARAT